MAITGAAGFVGSRLTRVLCDDGMSVLAVDREPLTVPRGGAAVVGDIRNEHVARAAASARSVVHLAAMTGVRESWTTPQAYWDCNVGGVVSLVEAMRGRSEPARLVFFSSSSVYAAPGPAATEDGPTSPGSPYGQSKLAGEGVVRAAQRRDAFDATVIRPFTLYGESQRANMAIAQLIECAVSGRAFESDGPLQQIRRDWTYVGDAISVTTRLLGAGTQCWPAVVNVGTGQMVSLSEVLGILEDLGLDRPPVVLRAPVAVQHVCADTTNLRNSFPGHRFTPLYEGISRQVEARLEAATAHASVT